jgi:AraC family transcriptional activator of pyochelin receptor
MNRKLISEKSGEISCAEILPDSLAGYRVPGEPFSAAAWECGDILFQEMNWEVHIRYTNYLLQEDDRIRIIDDRPLLALQFILSNSFYGDWQGLGKRIDHEASFNLFYVPSLEQSLEGCKGTRVYSKVEFQFPLHQLKLLAPHFPLLEQLLEQMDKGNPALLHKSNQVASSEMLTGVRQILHNPYSSGIKKIYAEAKGMGLLINALDAFNKNKPAPPPRLTHFEAEQVYQAKDLLLEHIDSPFSLFGLATQVGTSKFKLNNGFKEIYGVTVFDFLLNARMEKAQFLLLETHHTIESIAYLTGYNDPYSFSRAFKKYFGTSPKHYRARPFFFMLHSNNNNHS